MGRRILSLLLGLVLILSLPFYVYAEPSAEENGSELLPDERSDAELPGDEYVLEDEDGNLYSVGIEDVTDFPDGYDPALLEEAKEALLIDEDAGAFDRIEAVYEMTADLLPEETESFGAASFLHELLDGQGIENVLVNGMDEAGEECWLVLVRIFEDGDFFISDPVRDLGSPGGERTGFLLGTDDMPGFVFAEEFLTEKFAAAHPVSETAYEDPEPEEAEGEEAEEDEDAAEEEESAENKDAEEESAGNKDADEEQYGNAEVPDEKADDAEIPDESLDPEPIEEDGKLLSYSFSGTCGDNATWKLEISDNLTTGILTIGGSGATYNYNASSYTPWASYAGYITKAVVGAGITTIGQNIFTDLRNLTSVTFKGKKITDIFYESFVNDVSLKKITIPEGCLRIGYNAFYGCNNLASVSLPATLEWVGSNAFYGCSSAQITMKNKNTLLYSNAFYGCVTVYYPGTSEEWASIGGQDSGASGRVRFTTGIENAVVTLSATKVTYNGKVRKPAVKQVSLNGRILIKGTDYTLTYKKQKNVGRSYVVVRGINNYSGAVRKYFRIVRKTIKGAKVTGVRNLGYTGKARTQSSLKVKVKLNGRYVTLKKGRDYTVTYKRNKNISTSKSKALMTIKGKGNYAGALKKTFKIIKGNPGLKFSSKKLTKKALAGTFVRKAKKSVSSKLSLRYKSSKKSVAVVGSRTGRVTPKSVGTTTITVTSGATKYYKAGKASYKLTIRPLKIGELSYSFENYGTSSIPYSTFCLFFNSSQAYTYYTRYNNGGDGGNCFGLSSSTMMMNTPGSGVKFKDFASAAKSPSYFSWYNYRYTNAYTYKNSSTTLEELVEAMQVSQFSSRCSELLWSSNNTDSYHNRISALIKALKTGKPVLVAVTDPDQGGHALVAYKVTNENSSVSHLYIYDCNWPNATRYITLYKSNGRYTGGWYYYMNSDTIWSSARGGVLTYITDPQYKSIWTSRNADRRLSQMLISTDNFEIRDSEDRVAAVMKDGEFTSASDDIFLSYSIGADLKDHLVNMPKGEYSVVNTDPDAGGMEITAIDTNQTVKVETEASVVTVNVNGDENVSKAVIDAGEGERFEVTLLSDSEEEDGVEEIVFAGEGTGAEVTLGTEDGACIMDNADGVTLEVNGEKIAYVGE